jgi:hypothetical protein
MTLEICISAGTCSLNPDERALLRADRETVARRS